LLVVFVPCVLFYAWDLLSTKVKMEDEFIDKFNKIYKITLLNRPFYLFRYDAPSFCTLKDNPINSKINVYRDFILKYTDKNVEIQFVDDIYQCRDDINILLPSQEIISDSFIEIRKYIISKGYTKPPNVLPAKFGYTSFVADRFEKLITVVGVQNLGSSEKQVLHRGFIENQEIFHALTFGRDIPTSQSAYSILMENVHYPLPDTYSEEGFGYFFDHTPKGMCDFDIFSLIFMNKIRDINFNSFEEIEAYLKTNIGYFIVLMNTAKNDNKFFELYDGNC